MDKEIRFFEVAEPLNGAESASMEIKAGDGNLIIDQLLDDARMLATGKLQYFENQSKPVKSLVISSGHAVLSLQGVNRQHWIRMPWSACNSAIEWRLYLNPDIPTALTAHSDGGNVAVNLAGKAVTGVTADTGGGNVDVILAGHTANLAVTAKTGAGNVNLELGTGMSGRNQVEASSGAGNVNITIPAGIAARIHATSGLGGTSVDSKFEQIDKDTYQSPGFDSAGDKIEINAKSGAGVVMVTVR